MFTSYVVCVTNPVNRVSVYKTQPRKDAVIKNSKSHICRKICPNFLLKFAIADPSNNPYSLQKEIKKINKWDDNL